MTISRLCVTTTDNAGLQNLGRGGCKDVNPFKSFKGVIFTTKDFAFDDAEAFADRLEWVAGIKAGQVFPLPRLNTYEDISVEATYNESETQKRTNTRIGDYRFNYAWNLPFDVHKKLQSFRNAALRAFIVDEDGNVFGTNDAGKIKGFSISMINPHKMQFVSASADAPALSRVEVDYDNYREWDVYGESVPMAWNVLGLEPLTDVNLEVVGSPSATSVVIRVYSSSGLAADGTAAKVAVTGIIQADFNVSLTGTASGMTDNGDGTYTFAGTAFATGTINLKAPTAMTSDFGDFYIISTGAATVTI
jgi:hypothetical protein